MMARHDCAALLRLPSGIDVTCEAELCLVMFLHLEPT